VDPAAVELPEVRGPGAFGGSWDRFRRLLWRMALTDFTLRYHGSVLGYLWTLLNPLLLFAVLYVAFTQILGFGNRVEDYASLLLFNILLFTVFAESTSRALSSLVTRETLVRKVEFPRLVIPLSVVLVSLISFAFSLVVVIGFFLASGVPIRATWLLVPIPVLIVVIFTVGMSLLLSALYVRFRDVSSVWNAVSRASFYASPVLYPIEFFPDDWKFLLFINPLAPALAQARIWLIDPSAPSYGDVMGGDIYYLGPGLILVAICALGAWAFIRRAPRVAEEL